MIFLRRFLMAVVNIIFFTLNAGVFAGLFWFIAQLYDLNPDFRVYFLNTWWALLVIWTLIKVLEFLTGKEILRR